MRWRWAVPLSITLLVLLVAASIAPVASSSTGSGSTSTGASHAQGTVSTISAQGPGASAGTAAVNGSSAVSAAFDARVHETATALGDAGVPRQDIRLPYVGTPAQVVNGVVVPGYQVAQESDRSGYGSAPAPAGIAYYGASFTSVDTGEQLTTVDASSVVGSLTVNSIDALYLDTLAPDLWGIQLNSVLGNVMLHGRSGYEFWAQNAVDVYQHNNTINLGEDTWNFSSPGAYIQEGTATVLSHSSNSSDVAGLMVGLGPWLYAPQPFTLTLYLNSSVTTAGDQELWYNYSLQAAGGIQESGSYDWIVFNSVADATPAPVAPFVAQGSGLDPVGLPNDFEFDFALGGFDGATIDVLAANLSATLDYCPVSLVRCSPSQFDAVPSALSFGGETGETSAGLSESWSGTTVTAVAGPEILEPLWGWNALGGEAGATAVANEIRVSGAPDAPGGEPYAFVFFATDSAFDQTLEWAPDVPTWYLPPGVYEYAVLLSDYEEETGLLTVGSSATALAVTLPYHPASGVYTPLWAFSNAQLAGISTQGSGTLTNPYLLFDNPTDRCTDCGSVANDNISEAFAALDDYLFPVFAGILLNGTTAFVTANHEPSFCAYYEAWGTPRTGPSICFDLQIELVGADNVTLTHDTNVGGWPAMAELGTLAGYVPSAENLFPQANVMLWDSSHDLIASNDLVPTPTLPSFSSGCGSSCPPITCDFCISPEALLLYGGTDNTVWDNTFRDPGTLADSGIVPTTYGGLVEAESGDLIYNNNFAIDNPVVYLPYDLYTDSCPGGYAGDCGPLVPPVYDDTWNVSAQSATSVSETVNGVPLSGNVLGNGCGNQGGNFWSTYGDSLNPVSTIPFVNSYDYADDSQALPPGAADVQASILAGGDQLPLTRADCPGTTSLEVRETGLPAGTVWGLELASLGPVSSGTDLLSTVVPLGPLPFTALAPPGYGVARVVGPGPAGYAELNVTGATELTVAFGTFQTVTFEVGVLPAWPGLPSNTTWGLDLTPALSGGPPAVASTTNGSSVTFDLVRGAEYRFDVQRPDTETVLGGKGTLVVPAAASTHIVRFRPDTVAVRFVEAGLPARTNWSVTLTPISPAGSPVTVSGTTATLGFTLLNGTYAVAYESFADRSRLTGPTSLTVAAPRSQTIDVRYAQSRIVFVESGLPSGTAWGVNLTGPWNASVTSTVGSLAVALMNGTYNVSFWAEHDYTLEATTTVNVTAPHAGTVVAHYLQSRVVVQEVGLAAGTVWGVNLTGPIVVSSASASSRFVLELEQGTWTLAFWQIPGYTETAESSLTVTPPGTIVVIVTYARS